MHLEWQYERRLEERRRQEQEKLKEQESEELAKLTELPMD